MNSEKCKGEIIICPISFHLILEKKKGRFPLYYIIYQLIDIDLGKSLVGFIATTPIAYTTQKENYT